MNPARPDCVADTPELARKQLTDAVTNVFAAFKAICKDFVFTQSQCAAVAGGAAGGLNDSTMSSFRPPMLPTQDHGPVTGHGAALSSYEWFFCMDVFD